MPTNNSLNMAIVRTSYITSRWYPPGNLNCGGYFAGTLAIATGTIYFLPFIVPNTTTFKTIGIWLVTGVALGNVNLGLYASNSANTQPTGSPITNSTSGSLVATGSAVALSFTFGATITLLPGVYWIAVTASGSMTLQAITASGGYGNILPTFGFSALAAVPSNSYGWTQTFVYSTTLPAVGALSAISSSTIYVPMLQVN